MSCHLSGRMFYPNFLYKDCSSIKFSIAVYSPTAASEGCECPCCDIYSSDCTGTTEHGILKLVLNHTKQKRQQETKLTLFRKGQRFSRNHWEVILKMFHDNAVALSTLKLSVTSQGLVSSYVTCASMCKTHLWLGGQLGPLGFIFIGLTLITWCPLHCH